MDKKQFRRKLNIENAMENAKTDIVGSLDYILTINTNDISPWEFRDRKKWEMGDINELSNNIKQYGQIEPVIIVKSSSMFKGLDENKKYVLIAGFRRWTACGLGKLEVKCFLKDLTILEAAAILKSENNKEPVSDYSKGLYYSKLINKKCGTQDEVRKAVGETLSTFNNYLSFSQVPKEVWDSVKNLSKVSARTAAFIRSLINKDKKNITFLISIADKLSQGIGEASIKKLLNKKNKTSVPQIYKINDEKSFIYDNGQIKISNSILNKVSEKELLNAFNKFLEKFIKTSDKQ